LPAATAFPLERYCRLPDGFAVAAAAAGSSHIVLLSAAGDVIDTREAAAATAAAAAAAAEVNAMPAAVQAAELPAEAAAAAALAQGVDLAAEAAEELQQGDAHAAVDAVEVDGPQQQLGALQICNPWRPLDAAVTSKAAGGCVVKVLLLTCMISSPQSTSANYCKPLASTAKTYAAST
jgi:pyruvate/2-oxoglutarate dehydrogenase complex dihydrolipoamide acyltransferase (E2) component